MYVRLLVVLLCCAVQNSFAVRQGDEAPQFESQLMHGGEISLQAMQGKVVLVNFWASWCPPCRKELPELNNLFKEKSAEQADFVIVGVNIDSKRSNAQRMLKEFSIDFPVIFDPEKNIIKKYKGMTMPISFIINREGKVQHVVHGYSEKKLITIKQKIAEALSN